jgi:hypothetical protein
MTFEWGLICPSWIQQCSVDFGMPKAADNNRMFIRFWNRKLATCSRSMSHLGHPTLTFLFDTKCDGMPQIADNFVAFQILLTVEIEVGNCVVATCCVPCFSLPPLLCLNTNSAIN